MTTDDETDVRSKNTPAITAYCHRCRKRQQNENIRDKNNNNNFKKCQYMKLAVNFG